MIRKCLSMLATLVGWCLSALVEYLLILPLNLLGRYVVVPVAYVVGWLVNGIAYVVAMPVRLLWNYLVVPAASQLARVHVNYVGFGRVQTAWAQFCFEYGLRHPDYFSHEELVFGPDRFHLGRVQMMLQTAEAQFHFAARSADARQWLRACTALDSALAHIVSARAEMQLVYAKAPAASWEQAVAA